jgi:FkbH-like protein
MGSLEEYLESLEMVCDLAPFDAVGRARITQLTNKSNQFNLTTHRYTEAQIAEMEADPACFTLQVRLSDKFGDNGMISVVAFRADPDDAKAWACDTWLMSCRVLGRRVEEAVLAAVAHAAHDAGIARLIGVYLPTAKNKMVAEHFGKLGFERVSTEPDGASRWQLDLAGYEPPHLPMRLTGALAPAAV